MTDVSRIRGWLREHYPDHPHAHFGLSGAALLYDALRAQRRRTIVLPAFICPNISAMAACAGMSVIHMDTRRGTMHPDQRQLEAYLAKQAASETVVLMDHSFGYPFDGLANLRRRFRELLIIEDCVRALGVEARGRNPGEHADWVLLSMYKTIRGSQNGAVLLTRTPAAASCGKRAPVTLRERAATAAPLRFFYDRMQRRRPPFEARPERLGFREWSPQYGLPSELCMARFAAELREFESRARLRQAIAAELTGGLSEISGIECMQPAAGCRTAGHFVSFRIEANRPRDAVLASLYRKGLFLSRTWDILPAQYDSFSGTFPEGHAATDDLAEHVAHIPVRLFLREHERRQLIQELTALVAERAEQTAGRSTAWGGADQPVLR